MPDLLQRLQDFATRNLTDPVPPSGGSVETAPRRERPAVTPVAAGPTERDRFVSLARATVGGRYCSPPKPALYQKPRCTDCSGNVAWVYYQATGKRIPGDGGSHEQYNQAGRLLRRAKGSVPGEEWQPGDLLFYDTMGTRRAGNRANHVGIYVGNGQAVHAMNESQGIILSGTNSPYWNRAFLNAKRLWEIEEPEPQPEPGPRPVTAGAAPIRPAAPMPVTFATPARAIAPVTAARWKEILTDAQSPMAAEADAIYGACGPLITLAGAQSFKESQYGKAASGNNPLGLMERDGSTLMRFSSWTAGFAEYWRRMTDDQYKGFVYGPRDATLEKIIVTYVGGPGCWTSRGATCGNGETWVPNGGPDAGSINLYLYQTKARINRYLGLYDADPLWPDFVDSGGNPVPSPVGYTAHRIEGTTERLYLPSDIDFFIRLTPVWRSCNRSGKRLNWTGTRQHETGNTRPGTGAAMHAEWQYNGTQGHPDGCVAVHFYVDDHSIYQTLPINEQGIHSGDYGNQEQVAIEATVNSDGDFTKTKRNAAALEAGLLHIGGMTPEQHMWMHHELSGCPPNLRPVWHTFEQQVRAALDAIMRAV